MEAGGAFVQRQGASADTQTCITVVRAAADAYHVLGGALLGVGAFHALRRFSE